MPPSSPDRDGYRTLLKRLSPLSPPLFFMGGLGEQMLLSHRLTGPHADLDALVTRQGLARQLQNLADLGLAGPATTLQASPGHPLTLSAGAGQPPIEIWVCDPESGGGYALNLPGQSPLCIYRVFLPADTFAHPVTTVESVVIQTVSPLTRSVGEKRAQDLARGEQLRRTFLADREERELAPRLVQL